VSKSLISDIERGRKQPSKKSLEKLALALDIDKDKLLAYWEPSFIKDDADRKSLVRYKVLERDNFQCQLCGRTAPETAITVSRIVPFAYDGTFTEDNLIALCRDCNAGRLLSLKEKENLDNDVLVKSRKNRN